MGQYFGTNGVRGIVNRDFTLDLVSGIVSSAGKILGEEIALARDGRTSSPMFRDVAVASLLSIGCNVYDMGIIPTPTMQYALKELALDGGIMVTASHNPPEFNGIKVMDKDGVEVSRSTETKIEKLYLNGGPKPTKWDNVGKIYEKNVIDIYIKAVLKHVNVENIRSSKLKVALDTGNGVAVLVAPDVASRLGCNVYTLNTEIDGRFPGRGSEPTVNNLTDLKHLMDATDADIGVGFDGDGDRSIIMDDHGDCVWGDKTLGLITKAFMEDNPGETVVTPVSSSRLLEDVVSEYGGNIHWTRVGSVDVSRVMVEKGFLLGGEENGGVMYGLHHPVRDGTMTFTLILDIMANSGKKLSQLLDELPNYPKIKDEIPCPNNLKIKVLKTLQEKVDAPRIDTNDGLKLYFNDDSWILLRPSGTEPKFRIYAEAVKLDRVQNLVDMYKAIISETLESF